MKVIGLVEGHFGHKDEQIQEPILYESAGSAVKSASASPWLEWSQVGGWGSWRDLS